MTGFMMDVPHNGPTNGTDLFDSEGLSQTLTSQSTPTSNSNKILPDPDPLDLFDLFDSDGLSQSATTSNSNQIFPDPLESQALLELEKQLKLDLIHGHDHLSHQRALQSYSYGFYSQPASVQAHGSSNVGPASQQTNYNQPGVASSVDWNNAFGTPSPSFPPASTMLSNSFTQFVPGNSFQNQVPLPHMTITTHTSNTCANAWNYTGNKSRYPPTSVGSRCNAPKSGYLAIAANKKKEAAEKRRNDRAKVVAAARAAVPKPSTSSVLGTSGLTLGTRTLADPNPIVTTPIPPSPPDWDKTLESAVQALSPFVKIGVPHPSLEYSVLSDLLDTAPNLQVSRIERIVNPGLWKKFTSTRKELLTSKSNDWSLLSGLGLSDSELQLQAHVFLNFDPPPGIPSYSDNVALLFHCTKGKVDTVLSQGLDERLGRDAGLLGRGIYFADDPSKSVNYDSNGILILFAVFLGDCFSVDHVVNKSTFVREPEKAATQQRNHADLFFDSIVGRPAGVNEYVIYNRHQCVPLYLIHYTKIPWKPNMSTGNTYDEARKLLPPFAWSAPRSPMPLICPTKADRWPFFAQTIFKSMAGSLDTLNSTPIPIPALQIDMDTERKLRTLVELGFTDERLNAQTLARFGGNLERTADALLEPSPPPPPPTASLPLNFLPLPDPSIGTAFDCNSMVLPPRIPAIPQLSTYSRSSPPLIIDLTGTVGSADVRKGSGPSQSLPKTSKQKKLDNLAACIEAVASGHAKKRNKLTICIKTSNSKYSPTMTFNSNSTPNARTEDMAWITDLKANLNSTATYARIPSPTIICASNPSSTANLSYAANNLPNPNSAAATYTPNASSTASCVPNPSSTASYVPNPRSTGTYVPISSTTRYASNSVYYAGHKDLYPSSPYAPPKNSFLGSYDPPNSNPEWKFAAKNVSSAEPLTSSIRSAVPYVPNANSAGTSAPNTNSTGKYAPNANFAGTYARNMNNSSVTLTPNSSRDVTSTSTPNMIYAGTDSSIQTLTPSKSSSTACINMDLHSSTEEDTDCPICCNETSEWEWEELACSHKLCVGCHAKIQTSGRTMKGVDHTYIKCPFCQNVSGTEIGTCPDGSMTTKILLQSLPGYEAYGTISVNYVVSAGKYHLNRTGYLPNSPEGNRLLALLCVAWDRRLVFSIGTSMTTGQTDVLVWNIHHKTSMQGGVQLHAYPDPTYLDRLKEELQQYALQ